MCSFKRARFVFPENVHLLEEDERCANSFHLAKEKSQCVIKNKIRRTKHALAAVKR